MPSAGEAIDGTDATGWRAMRESRPRTGTGSIVGEAYLPASRIYQVRGPRAPASDPADRTKGAPPGGGAPRGRSGGKAYRPPIRPQTVSDRKRNRLTPTH